MARYVDADKLKQSLVDLYDFAKWDPREIHFSLLDMAANIDGEPTADVAPVVHAHWEKHFKRPGVYEDLYWHCTNCNSKTLEEYAPYWWLYCPHCGAKMDEEAE